MRKLSFLLVYVSVCTALVLGSLELILRWLDPIGIAYFYEAKKYFALMQRNNVYSYRHKPNLDVVLQDVQVRTNSHGFRGRDFDIPKPKDTYRVILLGDSVVFSWGVEEDKMLSEQVAPLLPEKVSDGRKVEVLPIGVGSWNTRVQYAFFDAEGKTYGADALAWVVVSNDLQPKGGVKTSVPPEELFSYKKQPPETWLQTPRIQSLRKNAAKHSFLAASLERFLSLAERGRAADDLFAPTSPYARDAKDAVLALTTLLRAQHIPTIAFLHGSEEAEFGRRSNALYSEWFKEANVPSYLFPEEMYHLTNSYIDPHQNAQGLTLMAKTIAEKLTPILSGSLPPTAEPPEEASQELS